MNNDEIKEIELDHFNNINELKQNVETWIKEDDIYWNRWFSLYDLKILLDYITNLQHTEDLYNQLLKDYDDLQQRIEKAVEYINHLSKEPNVFGHYGIHNDCAKWLLNILNGRSDE